MMSPNIPFLTALFDGKPEDAYLLLWTVLRTDDEKNPTKLSAWYQRPDDLSAAAARITDRDVYFGMGLSPMDYGKHLRGKANEKIGISCLWADIDILGVGHKKANNPPSREAALQLIAELPLVPSATVFTGGGYHIYWFLDRPWMFAGLDENLQAKQLESQWLGVVRYHAQQHGWEIDGVGDLARVFRVPGTLNHKVEPARPVVLETFDPNLRYSRETQILPAIKALTQRLLPQAPVGARERQNRETVIPAPVAPPASSQRETAGVQQGKIVLDGQASPPFDKFMALCECEPKFRASWDRTRKDMTDTSPSAWDFSMSLFMAMAGWTDQEMVNTLIASRREHHDDMKLDRLDYFVDFTIPNAKKTANVSSADEELNAIVVKARSVETLDPDDTEDVLRNLSTKWDIELIRIEKEMASPPAYHLVTGQGRIALGDVGGILNQSTFQKAVAAMCGVIIPTMKKNTWETKFAPLLLKACVPTDIGAEATDNGQVSAWLADYFDQRATVASRDEAFTTRQPYKHNNATYLFLSDFMTWLSTTHGYKTSSKDMGSKLRAYGCEHEVSAFTKADGSSTTRSVWRVPNML